MNHNKLLRFNLSKPLERRVPVSYVVMAQEAAKIRGNSLALLVSIHAEPSVQEKLQAMRESDAMLDRIGSVSAGFQGCKIEIYGHKSEPGAFDKYNPELAAHSIGMIEPNLANENFIFAKSFNQGSEKAAHETRTIAGNNFWRENKDMIN
jgi:hypothetical protein